MSKSKLLFFIDSLGSGGAQRQLVIMAKSFVNSNYEVEFLTYYEEGFFQKDLKSLGVEIYNINEASYFKRIIEVRKFIRNRKYDGVIAFLSGPCFMSELAALPFRKWKLIVGERSANPIMMKSLKFRVFRFFHIISDCIVTNSYENLKMIKKSNGFLPDKKIRCIYNSIDLDFWNILESYEYKKNNVLKLIVPASHQKLKNLNGLIEGVNLLPAELKDQIEIRWFGAELLDDSKQKGQKKIQEYNLEKCFKFFEPSTNIKEEMQNSDAVGLFSFYEGLSNALCEGMSCGKPIIATNVSDNALLIGKEHQELLCEPDDSKSIAKALKKLITEDAKELNRIGMRNRKFAENNFNERINMLEYKRIFENE